MTMTTTRPVLDVLWGLDDAETLSALGPDEAIEEYLDDHAQPLPASVTVVEYKRRVLALDADQIIEWIDDNLRDEYQHPDIDDGWDPTERVHDAAAALVELVKADYLPTICDVTGKEVTVNTAEWVPKHASEWLKENPSLLDDLEGEPQ